MLDEALKGASCTFVDDEAVAAAGLAASATTGGDSAPTRDCAAGLKLDGAENAPAVVKPPAAAATAAATGAAVVAGGTGGRAPSDDGVVATSPPL